MNWQNKNVLITGASGMLGSQLTSDLLGRRANVVAIMRDWVPTSELVKSDNFNKVSVVHGNLEDYHLVERVFNEYEVECCFHLAAQTIVGTANRSPLSTFDSNLKGTWNILEAARNSRLLEKLVVASSDKAYGTQEKLPYTEDSPLRASHIYDVSKTCTDLIAQAYYNTYSLPVGITRCGNIFGQGDLNFNRIVPGTIRSVLMKERPIIRSDGKFVRDYFYVKDASVACMALAEGLENKRNWGQAFNFSNEEPTAVLEIVQKILKLMNSKLKPVVLNQASGEIREQYLSSKKARSVLGWKPKYTLEAGVKETIGWYRAFFKGAAK
ncbi:MAG: GDP-mannose 4,6-dehydratase [archaeon]